MEKPDVWERNCMIEPSLITLDLCNLENAVRTVEQSGLSAIHVDVLDGYFSPSMPIGLDTIGQLRKKTTLLFDCHVMAEKPQFFIDELLDAGVDQITFQIETAPHVDGLLNYIHARGVRAGVALKPATPLHVLDYVLEKCDSVLLMLINPGYAQVKGESQVPYAEKKIRDLHEMIEKRNLPTKVILDGRVNPGQIQKHAENKEAQIFVAGSACVARETLREDFEKLHNTEQALNA